MFDQFNGFYIPSQPNAVYVNVAANVGFVNIAGHELWRTIKRQRPELIDWYRQHLRQPYKDLPAYGTSSMIKYEQHRPRVVWPAAHAPRPSARGHHAVVGSSCARPAPPAWVGAATTLSPADHRPVAQYAC